MGLVSQGPGFPIGQNQGAQPSVAEDDEKPLTVPFARPYLISFECH